MKNLVQLLREKNIRIEDIAWDYIVRKTNTAFNLLLNRVQQVLSIWIMEKSACKNL